MTCVLQKSIDARIYVLLCLNCQWFMEYPDGQIALHIPSSCYLLVPVAAVSSLAQLAMQLVVLLADSLPWVILTCASGLSPPCVPKVLCEQCKHRFQSRQGQLKGPSCMAS